MANAKILVSIFHKDGQYNENFESLKVQLEPFNIYVPTVDYYGNKWNDTKQFFLKEGFDSLFVICSDVKLIHGNFINKIEQYANNEQIGVYGFGTIEKCTFNWLQYDNIHLLKSVPFIEGYCFGANRKLITLLQLDNVYGYGLDVEMGYRSHLNGLKCLVDNDVCIRHEHGKSYSDQAATDEYKAFLGRTPEIANYLSAFGVPYPV